MNIIIGGDGLIGSQLAQLLPYSMFTSRHNNRATHLDLEKPELSIDPKAIEIVYMVAAITKAFECQRDQKTSHAVNVDGPLWVANYFRTSFFVFLSSEAAMYAQDTAYGRQKAQAELGLIAMKGYRGLAIIRPGRITEFNVDEACNKIIEIGKTRKYGVTLL